MGKKAVTVCGEVDAGELGRTLTHEHLSLTIEVMYVPPKKEELSQLDWTLKNYGYIWQNPYSHKSNVVMNDPLSESAVLDSVGRFASLGGGCIVENSTAGLERKSAFCREVTRGTGVHVIAGTGYYVVAAQDKDVLPTSVEEMAKFMTGELDEGCVDFPEVKCGFIGEIGCTWPLHDFERKTIAASAAVQESLGCAVSFHPGRHPDAPAEIMRVFQEAGGRADKAIMSHLENDIVALNKPYGLPMFDQSGKEPHTVEKYLPQLAEVVGTPYLHEVHRLDKTTSGVLLLAATEDMRRTLVELFKRRKIDKRYWAIVRGVPEPKAGILDIPLSEAKLPSGRYRVTVQPDEGGHKPSRRAKATGVYPAVTEYRTLKEFLNMSLVEVRPVTGFKHQIRAHLGFGLGCPVLGDHKFSYIDEIGKPQKISGETLHRLGIRQSRVRDLPILLHAKHVQIPDIVPGKQVWVDAALPHYFNRVVQKLKLRPDGFVKI